MAQQEKHYEYEVGYGKPPKSSQFKKGNPGFSSRMRRMRQAQAHQHLTAMQIAATVLEEKISVSAGRKRKRMTKTEALVRSLVSAAIKGDPLALKVIMAWLPKLVEPPGAEIVTTRVAQKDLDALFDQVLEDAKTWPAEEAAAADRHEQDHVRSKTKPVAPEEADIEHKNGPSPDGRGRR